MRSLFFVLLFLVGCANTPATAPEPMTWDVAIPRSAVIVAGGASVVVKLDNGDTVLLTFVDDREY